MRKVGRLTNLIPLIARADTHSQEELAKAKSDRFGQLNAAGVEMFDIGFFNPREHDLDLSKDVNAVSSAPARDDETIDASLLMSSAYIHPLEASDLPSLVERLFDPGTATRLRHQALRSFLQWRRQQVLHMPSLSINSLQNPRTPLHLPTFHQSSGSSITANSLVDSTSPNAVLVARRQSAGQEDYTDELSSPSSSSPPYSPNAYTAARVLDHTQREERMAQVRLARWGSDLQRALRNERLRFAALKEAERTAWLRERLRECIDANYDGSDKKPLLRRPSHVPQQVQQYRLGVDDPLGLFEWRARLSRRGVMVAKMVGSAGVVGAVMIWLLRTWGSGLDLMPDGSSHQDSRGVSGWWWARG